MPPAAIPSCPAREPDAEGDRPDLIVPGIRFDHTKAAGSRCSSRSARTDSCIHHVTFKVPSLAQICDGARAIDYEIIGYDDSHPDWKEAFLHPKQAQGLVVQFAETTIDGSRR